MKLTFDVKTKVQLISKMLPLLAISGSPPDAAAAMRAAAALEFTFPSAPVTAAMNRFLSSSDIFGVKSGSRDFDCYFGGK